MTNAGFFCLLIYVDDVLLAGPYEKTIAAFKEKLHNLFTIKNLGKARFFLGLEIGRSDAGMIITQSKYMKEIIVDTGLAQAKAVNTPLPAGLQLRASIGQQLANPEPYRKLLGRLLYLGFTRADICHIGLLARKDEGFNWILYISREELNILENQEANDNDLRIKAPTPISFSCDNQAALYIAANSVIHERTKHIEIDCHLVRNKYKEGFIAPKHIASKEQPTFSQDYCQVPDSCP
ncbi:uncharacterized protein LOC105162780 [Sesamum indicum]|uniref:Uncharacterized protein LOC105162780 n=1 Tax=Sesamum indicum TaxID=4182 RepID=A0A6I9T5L8_SESIN|nr:uncharacterized protein LOC105162780 [Sesamum indicum]